MSELNATLYDLTQNAQGQLFYAMQKRFSETLDPLPVALQLRGGYAESPGWFMVQAAEFAPDPLTIEALRVRDIYASERIVQALLELLAGERWLDRIGDAYHLTEKGKALLAQLRSRTAKVLGAEVPFPAEQLVALEAALRKIIDLSLATGDGEPPWCLAHSRNRAPKADTAVSVRLSQLFSDFNAFRDDAHMAAWQPVEKEGYIWEAFHHIATNQAHTAHGIYDNLFFRGYPVAAYQAAIDSLLARGWVEADADGVKTAVLGQTILKQVEDATDAYFFAPWQKLAANELTHTITLLQSFHDTLKDS